MPVELPGSVVGPAGVDAVARSVTVKASGPYTPNAVAGQAHLDSLLVDNGVVFSKGAEVSTYGPSNGVDDTAGLNAHLLARAGGTVVLTQGSNYKISTPLIISSNTRLDLNNATITLLPGSNCNMLQNYSLAHPVATASDAAMTNGSNVVTTSLGATAVAGQTVVVAGAGGTGNGPVVGNVLSATPTTITLVTLDGRSSNCTKVAGVTAAAITLYNRDSNIDVIDGTWARGANAGSGTGLHSLMLRHIDRVTVDIDMYTSSAGKYGIALGGCTAFWIRVKNSNCFSSPFQMNGPAWNGRIEYIGGTNNDDLCALTCSDFTAYQDTGGDIVDVQVGIVCGTSVNANLFKILAGVGRLATGIKVGLVTGTVTPATGQNGVWIGDAIDAGIGFGGTYGDIDIDMVDVVSVGTSWYPVYLVSVIGERIRVKLSHRIASSGRVAVAITGSNTATLDVLIIEGDVNGTAFPVAQLNNVSQTVRSLILKDVEFHPASSQPIFNSHHGTLTELTLENCKSQTSSGATHVTIDAADAGISRIHVIGGAYSGGANFLTDVAGNVCTLTLAACDLSSLTGSAVVAAGTMTVALALPTLQSITNAAFKAAGGTLTVVGQAALYSATTVGRAAAESVRVNGPTIPVDVAILTPTSGDLANHTNAATYPYATGPASYDGTKWRPIQGYMAASTAVLAAGTKAVADTKITATSLIRVYNQTVGGTRGALWTENNNGVGFTIFSTNASDTSTIAYEVERY